MVVICIGAHFCLSFQCNQITEVYYDEWRCSNAALKASNVDYLSFGDILPVLISWLLSRLVTKLPAYTASSLYMNLHLAWSLLLFKLKDTSLFHDNNKNLGLQGWWRNSWITFQTQLNSELDCWKKRRKLNLSQNVQYDNYICSNSFRNKNWHFRSALKFFPRRARCSNVVKATGHVENVNPWYRWFFSFIIIVGYK